MPSRAKLTKSERWMLILTAAFVFALGGGAWFFYWINVDPVVSIPMPVMPAPNARDVYLQAANQVVDAPPIAPTEQGILRLNDVSRLIHGGVLQTRNNYSVTGLSSAWIHRLLAANAPGIAHVRKGIDMAYRAAPARTWHDLNIDSPLFNHGPVNMITASGKYACLTGDWDAGTDTLLDACACAEQIWRGGTFAHWHTTTDGAYRAREDLWAATHHVSAATARHAAQRLEELDTHRATLASLIN